MNVQTGFADVNGTRLYYEVAGSEHPIVLVHGFSLDTRMWDDQFEVFARHYKVIRYDIRGYGKSSTPSTEGYYHADDLKGLLDHLSIERAHILGLSLGGAIAIEFAAAYPSMTSALILVDSVLWGHNWSEEGSKRDGAVWAASSVEAARQSWLDHPLFTPALVNRSSAGRLTQIVTDYSGWHWENNDPGLLPDPLAAQRLHEISAPTLVIIGELDLLDFQAIAQTLQQQIPNARTVTLHGVGHMSNMEDPERFNKAVLSFLKEL
jgi:3-oxoadipate enol-lactonase